MSTLVKLPRRRSLELLASTPMGRIVFTERALPAIRPVNHLVDGDVVIIRSELGSAIVRATYTEGGLVVAYEADAIDPVARTGWSVVVTGTARVVEDVSDIQRYEKALRPWVGSAMNCVIRVTADLVDGFELVPTPDDGPLVPTAPPPPAGA